jgi:hypothetical protein
VDVPNKEEQENSDDALNGSEDSGSDYMSEEDKERFVAEQKEYSEEINDFINVQRTGYHIVNKLGSIIFRKPGSH